MIQITRLSGEAIRPCLPEVARLRIGVFREYPYLYDGSEAYERDYLQVYVEAARSVVVLAIKDGEIIGASTGLPLEEADEAFRKPFEESGIDPRDVFYFGESILKPSERGQGIGHRFFDEREAHAREHGFSVTAFCAVERQPDHPMKPADYRANDAFWNKRGYVKTPSLCAELDWKQVDEPQQEVCNSLVFWTKNWGGNDAER